MTWLRTESVAGFDEVLGLRPAGAGDLRRDVLGTLARGARRFDARRVPSRGSTRPPARSRPDEGSRTLRGEPGGRELRRAVRTRPARLRDDDFDRLHEFFDDAELATLTLAVAMFDARARFSVALEA